VFFAPSEREMLIPSTFLFFFKNKTKNKGRIRLCRFPPRPVSGKTRSRFWYCGDQMRVVWVYHGGVSWFLDVFYQKFDAGN
jgi:hypothetical protein